MNMYFSLIQEILEEKILSNLIAAYSLFKENLPEDKKDKVALVLHTQPIDDNGTDLFTVRRLIFRRR
jgi:hypothetical protein